VRLDRLQAHRNALHALGKSAAEIINFIVLGLPEIARCRYELSALAQRLGCNNGVAKGHLLASLDLLSDWYNPDGAEYDAVDPFAAAA
jgi:hypothetical protein